LNGVEDVDENKKDGNEQGHPARYHLNIVQTDFSFTKTKYYVNFLQLFSHFITAIKGKFKCFKRLSTVNM
jgi:hypothetical protein